MALLHELLESLQGLLEQGGGVLGAIFALSVLMWTLILERYWYIHVSHPRRVRRVVAQWTGRSDHVSWYARRIREGLIAEVTGALERFLLPIETLTAVLPLLGLLGTVTGMIRTFDVITLFGTGNARGLAAGISEALITTTAGLVTAISGLYFSAHLRQRANAERHRLADRLV
jgi:biopolymer transport protein ExbB